MGAMPMGFESSWSGGGQANSGPQVPKAGAFMQRENRVLGPAELASLAAAAFKEPLSTALGTNTRPSPSPPPPAVKQKPRGEWVTFDSKGKADPPPVAPAAVGESGFAPLDTVPSSFVEPSARKPSSASSQTQPQHGWGFDGDGADDWAAAND